MERKDWVDARAVVAVDAMMHSVVMRWRRMVGCCRIQLRLNRGRRSQVLGNDKKMYPYL